MIDEIKKNGRVYTPAYIVDNILDLTGYTDNIRKKHVIDNSCGDGAFLKEIVHRYCECFKNTKKDELKNELELYIHGIEIEKEEQQKCINNLNKLIKKYGLDEVNWDIKCADTIKVKDYDGKMDFVLGNPPYVRVHNLGDSFDEIKRFSYAQQGMTDLFIVFYEIGIKMLNKNGILGYITPNSFFNSVAGTYMREQFISNNYLSTIVDLKHYQAFNAMTYTAITILKKNKKDEMIKYYEYDSENKCPVFIENLKPSEIYINNNFYFSTRDNLRLLKKVFYNIGEADLSVKNGYATLCDKVFISNFDFSSDYIRPIVKASRGMKKSMIFPYDSNGFIIDEEELKKQTELYNYLLENKEKLLARSREHSNSSRWYSFGRSQAISDTYKDKIAINNLVKTIKEIKLTEAPAGTGVYSGLYIISSSISTETIKNALLNDEFVTYVSLLGKYKSGGYYTFSSKDLSTYLNYKLNYERGLCDE